MDAEPLVDASIQIRQTLDPINGSDRLVFRSKFLVKFLLKLLLDVWIADEMIYDSANCTRIV